MRVYQCKCKCVCVGSAMFFNCVLQCVNACTVETRLMGSPNKGTPLLWDSSFKSNIFHFYNVHDSAYKGPESRLYEIRFLVP